MGVRVSPYLPGRRPGRGRTTTRYIRKFSFFVSLFFSSVDFDPKKRSYMQDLYPIKTLENTIPYSQYPGYRR